MDFERKVGPKGQVVIPRDIRRLTGIQPDMTVHIHEEDGRVIIHREREKLADKLEKLAHRDGWKGTLDADKAYDEARAERWRGKRM